MSIIVKTYKNVDFSWNYKKKALISFKIERNFDLGQNLQQSRIWSKFSKNLDFG